LNWLLRQLKDALDALLIETSFANTRATTATISLRTPGIGQTHLEQLEQVADRPGEDGATADESSAGASRASCSTAPAGRGGSFGWCTPPAGPRMAPTGACGGVSTVSR
jgi:hypothetical protein